jgi:hypothetical protein
VNGESGRGWNMWSGPNLRYYPGILVKEYSKTPENISQDCGPRFKPGISEYETRILPAWPLLEHSKMNTIWLWRLYCNVYWMVHVTNNYGIRLMIGFINNSVKHAILITVTSKHYSSIVDLHFIQLAVANALGFPLFSTSRLRATAFNTQL